MQGSKLYVGNLKYSTTNDELKSLFDNYGRVVNVNILDGKGFGFVEMSSPDEADKAKDALDFNGRILRVNEANPPGTRRDRDRNDRHRF